MLARSHRFVFVALAPALALLLLLAACGDDDYGARSAGAESAAADSAGAAPAPAGAGSSLPAADPNDGVAILLDATRLFASGNCSVVRSKLEYCSACETDALRPHRDLLLAYCREREEPAEARALYETLITKYPNTEASVTAIMRVRQLDAAALPAQGDYGGAKPTPVQRHGPAYPSLAEQAGIAGKVRLRFDVREDGGVSNVRVVESTPPLLFDSVALYAVSSWEYEKGKAAEGQQITLRFEPESEAGKGAPPAAGAAAK